MQDVALNGIVPTGQLVPGTMLHTPVVGSQHRMLGGTHGLAGTHVEPVPPQTPGGGHAAALATMVHTLTPAAFTVQHAPCVPGGHGFGLQEVAVTAIEPVGHEMPLTIWQIPVPMLQQIVLGGTHGFTGTHVEPTPPQMPGAGQAVGPETMLHTVAPAALTVQHAPLVGCGHGLVGTHVALVSTVPLHGVPSGTMVQLPSVSQHAYRLAALGHGFGLHVVMVAMIWPLQLPGA